jgi:hypothetical protein
MKFKVKYNGKDLTPRIKEAVRVITEIYILALVIAQLDRWAYIHHVMHGKPMPYYRGMWFATAVVLGSGFVFAFITSLRNKEQEEGKS